MEEQSSHPHQGATAVLFLSPQQGEEQPVEGLTIFFYLVNLTAAAAAGLHHPTLEVVTEEGQHQTRPKVEEVPKPVLQEMEAEVRVEVVAVPPRQVAAVE